MSKYLVKYDLETEKGQFTKEECVSEGKGAGRGAAGN